MKLEIFPNGIYGATTYFIYDEDSHEGAIVDATCSIEEIKEFACKNHINLKYILVTHGHFDHVYCLKEAKEAFKTAQILIHKNDKELLDNMPIQCSMSGLDNVEVPCVDGLLDDNSHNLKLGEKEIKVIHTKGHSKGGVCYLIDDFLFSGDTLFQGSIGRYDLWGGSEIELRESITQKLFALDDDVVVYPGHGDKTTIGYEKKYNPYYGSGV